MSQSWTDVLAGPCHRCAFLLCLFRIPNSILFTYSICNSRSLANPVRHIFPNALYFIHFNYVYIYIVDRRIRISFRSRVVLPGWHDRESSFMILSFFRIHINPLRETWMASVARSARSSAPFYSRFRNRCMPTTICKGAVDALVEGERTADATDLQGFAYRMPLHIRWQLYILYGTKQPLLLRYYRCFDLHPIQSNCQFLVESSGKEVRKIYCPRVHP